VDEFTSCGVTDVAVHVEDEDLVREANFAEVEGVQLVLGLELLHGGEMSEEFLVRVPSGPDGKDDVSCEGLFKGSAAEGVLEAGGATKADDFWLIY